MIDPVVILIDIAEGDADMRVERADGQIHGYRAEPEIVQHFPGQPVIILATLREQPFNRFGGIVDPAQFTQRGCARHSSAPCRTSSCAIPVPVPRSVHFPPLPRPATA